MNEREKLVALLESKLSEDAQGIGDAADAVLAAGYRLPEQGKTIPKRSEIMAKVRERMGSSLNNPPSPNTIYRVLIDNGWATEDPAASADIDFAAVKKEIERRGGEIESGLFVRVNYPASDLGGEYHRFEWVPNYSVADMEVALAKAVANGGG